MLLRCSKFFLVLSVITTPMAWCDEPPAVRDVQTIAREARSSLVVFSVSDRDGQTRGVGTGFIISDDGLVATNLHVIGEGRKFAVEMADGKAARVKEVHAADRHLDLAIVRIEPPVEHLAHLDLAEADSLAEGASIVVMGNPYGLKHSVVSGVLSGRRELEGRRMLQLAIPIEPGNSGGPVLDMQGHVQGIVTMKSLVAENLGFAVDAQLLKTLLEKPNPVPIDRWHTIGSLDARQWTPLFGANWRQRASRISVEGAGQGFGGRSLCLSANDPPELPFELAVSVKLDDEAGAAGLVFHSDGSERHYGFYPSNGNLRLTCFDGATVFQWRVIRDEPSPHYRRGDWNQLRVRVEEGRFQCFVNDQLVYDVQDEALQSGKVGLAKFRETKAEFRGFTVAKTIAAETISPEDRVKLEMLIAALAPGAETTAPILESLRSQAPASTRLLQDRAKQLQDQAQALLRTAADVRLQIVIQQLEQLVAQDDFDLTRGALLLAHLDDPDLDVDGYVHEVERMAHEIRGPLAKDADQEARFAALKTYLFEQNGFHGSRHEYYHRANSYLNRVIDDREGIPITLSVLFMELGRQLDLNLEGVGLPGHFIVRWRKSDDNEQLVDVFEGATLISREAALRIGRDFQGAELTEDQLHAVPRRAILERMLMNLIGLAQRDADNEALRRYTEALVVLVPDSAQFRGMRALARFETGRYEAAIGDLDWFLENKPEGVDLDRIQEMRDYFQRKRSP